MRGNIVLGDRKKTPVFLSDDRGGPIVIGDREKDDESLFLAPLA